MENVKVKPHPLFYPVIIGALGLMAAAVYAWITQITDGLGVTGMSRPITWGIYIINFVFFIGVSAGGIAVAALANLGGIARYKSISRISEVVAIISLVLALTAIFLDLGRPERFYNLILYAQFFSPLTWDMVIINIYFVLCAGLLYASLKGNDKMVKTLSWISLPVFVMVHSVTAWIFGLVKGQPGWHSAILAPLFIVSALASGLGMVILALLFTKKVWRTPLHHIEDDVTLGLGRYFKILLPVLFYFLFSEFITIAYANVPEHNRILSELFTGNFAYIFWFDMVLGIVVPFILIMSPLGNTYSGVAVTAVLTTLGVLAERTNIILPTFYHHDLISTPAVYTPTWVEWVLMLGLWSGGLLLYSIALRFIPAHKPAPVIPASYQRREVLEGTRI
ncbi:MAG: polysulfide reductase NrfD [Planctomycetes bacterium]|nr:polysulfide reductase NrfD [Planctomycetota bacterium]